MLVIPTGMGVLCNALQLTPIDYFLLYNDPEEARASPQVTWQDRRRIQGLERDLRRKNTALARRTRKNAI